MSALTSGAEVFHAYHSIRAGISVFDTLCFVYWILANNLDPVAVRIQRKCNTIDC